MSPLTPVSLCVIPEAPDSSMKLVIASTFLFLFALPAVAREEHPLMHNASEALRAAQGAADPLVHLEKARRNLIAARNNKGGHRADAIKLTEEAISALQKGKRIDADKAIKEALNLIEKGVALHPRDN